MDIRCGMQSGSSASVPCLLGTVTWELAKFILDVVEVQEVRSETGNIEPPEDFTISLEKCMRMYS
jgi:hypothetical protein